MKYKVLVVKDLRKVYVGAKKVTITVKSIFQKHKILPFYSLFYTHNETFSVSFSDSDFCLRAIMYECNTFLSIIFSAWNVYSRKSSYHI